MRGRANDCRPDNMRARIDRLMHCSSGGRWVVRLLSVLFAFATAQSTSVYAQQEAAQTVRAKAVLQATVTTQSSIPLGGVRRVGPSRGHRGRQRRDGR